MDLGLIKSLIKSADKLNYELWTDKTNPEECKKHKQISDFLDDAVKVIDANADERNHICKGKSPF
jgi:hypothetical protein